MLPQPHPGLPAFPSAHEQPLPHQGKVRGTLSTPESDRKPSVQNPPVPLSWGLTGRALPPLRCSLCPAPHLASSLTSVLPPPSSSPLAASFSSDKQTKWHLLQRPPPSPNPKSAARHPHRRHSILMGPRWLLKLQLFRTKSRGHA